MGDEEIYTGIGKLYVGVAGDPLQELQYPVKCNMLTSYGTLPNTWKPTTDEYKKSFEVTFDIKQNPEFEKIKEMLFNDAANAVEYFYTKIDEFSRIFVEDYLCLKYDKSLIYYAKEHELSSVWNEEHDSFYGLLMDGKLYSVSGLLFTWNDGKDLTLYDKENPMWANEKILEKLKTLNFE